MWNHHNERKVRTNFTALFLCPSNSSKITTTLKEMYEVVYAVSFKGFIAPLTYLLMAIETSFWWSMRKFSLLILSSLLYDTIVGHKIMVKLKFWLKIIELWINFWFSLIWIINTVSLRIICALLKCKSWKLHLKLKKSF